ncbi:MAG: Na+/H+ antiporter subunit E [Thiolinea sp.]
MLFAVIFTLAMLALWLLLASGDFASLLLGIPFIALAWWSYRLQKRVSPQSLSFSLPGAVRFLVFFLWESMRGGLDVASRVWRPHIPLAPDFIEYRLIFPEGPVRALFLYTISLLPGTLSVIVDENDRLQVHTLDASGDLQHELARLETRICDLFALPCAKEA